MNKIRSVARRLLKSIETWKIIESGQGWKKSFESGRPVNRHGQSLAWYTYPALEFIDSMDFSEMSVLEFGAGYSSFYWSTRARSVRSIESDSAWCSEVRSKAASNMVVVLAEGEEAYLSAARCGSLFDVVVIDGLYRAKAALVALEVVSEAGMIILDNAEWHEQASAALREAGWTQINFSGLGPINPYAWTTSIFLRAEWAGRYRAGCLPVGTTRTEID